MNEALEVNSSRLGLVINKYREWAAKNNINLKTFTKEEEIRNVFSDKTNKLSMLPGVTLDNVIDVMTTMGMVVNPAPPKKEKPVESIELPKLSGLKSVDDPGVLQQLEENKEYLELEENVFNKDPQELDKVLKKALSLEKETIIENDEYYEEFADLVQGGIREVRKDLEDFAKRKDAIKKRDKSFGKEQTSYKVAMIVERAIAYAISHLHWYGNHIKMESVCQFIDIMRGCDGVVLVETEGQSSRIGVGVDATYRGLLSKIFKDKFYKLLESIQGGYATNIKYFTNHKGEMMEEFSVPKVVLSFDTEDVKELVYMIKNIDDPDVKKSFKNSSQKHAVMNQILIQCEILAAFAEESGNDIAGKYYEVVDAIQELGKNNSEIQQMLDARHEDQVAMHMKFLIQQFKDQQPAKAA